MGIGSKKTIPDLTGYWSFRGHADPAIRRNVVEYSDVKAKRNLRLKFSIAAGNREAKRYALAMERTVRWYFLPPRADFRPTIILFVNRYINITASEYTGGVYKKWKYVKPKKPKAKVPRDTDWSHFTNFIVRRKQPISKEKAKALHENDRDIIFWADDDVHPSLTADIYQTHHVFSLKPRVVVVRVQNSSLVPAFGEPLHMQKVLGGPLIIKPDVVGKTPDRPADQGAPAWAKDKKSRTLKKALEAIRKDSVIVEVLNEKDWEEGLKQIKDANPVDRYRFPWEAAWIVRNHPRGVRIEHAHGKYEIDILIKDEYKAAAYSYRFGIWNTDYRKSKKYYNEPVCAVVHDNNNVIVQFKARDDYEERVKVWSKKLPLGAVPVNGVDTPGWADIPTKPVKRTKKKSRFALIAQLVVEVGIGFIPVVGFLYDLGQMAYMIKYGEDFFGNEISPSDIAATGAFVAIGVAFKGAKSVQRLIDAGKFPVDKEVLDLIEGSLNQKAIVEGINAGSEAGLAAAHMSDNAALHMLTALSDAEKEKVIGKLVARGGNIGKNSDVILRTFLDLFTQSDTGVALAKGKRAGKGVASGGGKKTVAETISGDGTTFIDQGLADLYIKYLTGTP